jgi:hypothetical protein
MLQPLGIKLLLLLLCQCHWAMPLFLAAVLLLLLQCLLAPSAVL